MHFAHPLGVALCKIIVYGYDMHPFPRKRVEVCGQRGNECFSFTRAHFCDTPLVQTDTADDLNVEMLHAEHAHARFAKRRERVV